MQKPRNLIDIKTRRINTFSNLTKKLSLYRAQPRLEIKKPILIGACFSILFLFLFSFALAPSHLGYSLAAQATSAERAALEAQLAELEAQMAQQQEAIDRYKQEGKNLKSTITLLNDKINKTNLQIKAITLSLEKLGNEIADNQEKITQTEDQIALNKSAISDALQNVYENEDISLIAVLLKNPNLSDFFGDLNNLLDVQTSLLGAVQKISVLKDELLTEKEELALKRNDAAAYKAYQDAQRAAALETKKQKDTLLAVTKGQESKYQELLKQTKESAAQIRSRIFEFLGGGEMTFADAYNYARLAEKATGVRSAFVLAVLSHESALGANVGKCSYKTAMSPGIPPRAGKRDDISLFLQITAALEIGPDSVTVSCANRDGAFGGAMGPAQFIPTTWMLYSNRIQEITGSNPASPWRNGDALVATSLYLKDALGACTAYSGVAKERCAAARYYAGSRWQTYLWTYGDRVVTRAAQFEQDIAVLNS